MVSSCRTGKESPWFYLMGNSYEGCDRVTLASDDVSMIGSFPTSQIDSSPDEDLSDCSALDCMRSDRISFKR